MIRILINECNKIIRESKKITFLAEYEEIETRDSYNIEYKEMLNVLDEKYRIIVELFYGEGYKIREISKILNIPESTIQTRLQRAREQLAKFYGTDNTYIKEVCNE